MTTTAKSKAKPKKGNTKTSAVTELKARAKEKSTKATNPAKSDTKSAGASTPLVPVSIRIEETELPLKVIVPSPENRSITPDSLDTDFIDSLRTFGVQNRVWVYPLSEDDKRRKKGATHELIAGERRWCGSGVVGLSTIPVKIYHCTEQQADELRVLENLQRENLTEIEEGRSYARMIEKHGFVVEDDKHPERSLKHRLNKSKSYIVGRIKLLEAPKLVQEALASGDMQPSVALRVARIPDPKLQVQAAKDIMGGGRFSSGPMTDKQAAEHIAERYMTQLKGAPFDTKEANLVPVEHDDKGGRIAGGACTDCPMRSGNQAELFGDGKKGGRGDVCTNPSCYARKVEASWLEQCAQAKAEGKVILSEEDAQGIFYLWGGDRDQLNSNCRYVFPQDACPDDPKGHTFAQLLGDPIPLSVTRFFVRGPKSKRGLTLFLRQECKAAIIAAGHQFYAEKSEAKKEQSVDGILRERKQALQDIEREWKLAHVVDVVRAALETQPPLPILHHLAAFSFMAQPPHSSFYGGPRESDIMRTLRRWNPVKLGEDASRLLSPYMHSIQPAQIAAFMLELALRRLENATVGHCVTDYQTPMLEGIAKAYGVELSAKWEAHLDHLAECRKACIQTEIQIEQHFLAELHDAYSADRICDGRSVQSAEWCGLSYTVTGAESSSRGVIACTAWEMVPRKAYTGKTYTYAQSTKAWEDDKLPRGSYEGTTVTQKGVEYVLSGPPIRFIQRRGQCSACGCTELNLRAAGESCSWANEEQTLCAKCDGKEAKI